MSLRSKVVRFPAGLGVSLKRESFLKLFTTSICNEGFEDVDILNTHNGVFKLYYTSDDLIKGIVHNYISGLVMDPVTKKPLDLNHRVLKGVYDTLTRDGVNQQFYSFDLLLYEEKYNDEIPLQGIKLYDCFPMHAPLKCGDKKSKNYVLSYVTFKFTTAERVDDCRNILNKM